MSLEVHREKIKTVHWNSKVGQTKSLLIGDARQPILFGIKAQILFAKLKLRHLQLTALNAK